jgi:hypothetical protein
MNFVQPSVTSPELPRPISQPRNGRRGIGRDGGRLQPNAPSSLTAGLDPMQIVAQSLAQQSSPKALAMQELSQVGQEFINNRVMPKHFLARAEVVNDKRWTGWSGRRRR